MEEKIILCNDIDDFTSGYYLTEKTDVTHNNMEGFNGGKNNIMYNNIFSNRNNMINMMNQPNNKFQNAQMFGPEMNNNFYLPYQFGNNMNNSNNNILLPNMMSNNFGMNYNNGNNMNNYMQFQQKMNNNDNNSNNIPNGSNMISNFNNQQ